MSEWARPPGEVEIFATGDTEVIMPGDDTLGRAIADVARRGGTAVLEFHARPGHRPGTPLATSSGRRSGPSDIVRPVLVDPRRASALAADGELFRDRLAGLDLDDHQADDSRRFLVWTGRLTGHHVGVVPVSLHLLASPSLVVTVLELVPQERLGWHRRPFVKAGIEVVEALADRLAQLTDATSPVPAAV